MDTFEKAIIGGVILFAGYELFFAPKAAPSGGIGTAPKAGATAPQTRYTIKSGVVMFPVAEKFSPGDLVTVELHDGKTGTDLPMILIVAGNMGDPTGLKGLDAVYSPSAVAPLLPAKTPMPPSPEGLLDGTHFAVFPHDVIAVLPKDVASVPASTPATGLFSHVMTETDIDLTPVGFASLAGYGDSSVKADAIVQAFVADNPGLSIVTASNPASTGGVHPEVFPVFGKAPGSDIDTVQEWLAVQPWAVGMTVHTRKDMGGGAALPTPGLPLPTASLPAVAGDGLPHGVVPFGGAGFGKNPKGAIALPRNGVG